MIDEYEKYFEACDEYPEDYSDFLTELRYLIMKSEHKDYKES